MTKRYLAVLASIAIVSSAPLVGSAGADSPQPTYKRLQHSDVKFRKKSGYWVECHYSGTGEVCEYVYARPRSAHNSAAESTAKLRRIKTEKNKFKRKSGYWVECHYSGTGEVCEYVYAKPR